MTTMIFSFKKKKKKITLKDIVFVIIFKVRIQIFKLNI